MHIINRFRFLLIITSGFVFSQEQTNNLVITVLEEGINHGKTEAFYWIIPVNSIDTVTGEYIIFPLYFADDLTNDALTKCHEGNKINLFTSTADTNYDFDKSYIKEIDSFETSLKSNLVFIQKITKKWRKTKKKNIIINVTPVSGVFQYCLAGDKMKKRFNVGNKIVFPISNLKVLMPEYIERVGLEDFLLMPDFSKYSITNRRH